MENKLKPCPFCGGNRIRVKEGISDKYIKFTEPVVIVGCVDCNATVGAFRVNYKYYENTNARTEAIKAWNRRTEEKDDEKN